MRNAIPIGFIALVGILYMTKDKAPQMGNSNVTPRRATVKAKPRKKPKRRWRVSKTPPRGAVGSKRKRQFNQQALMKRIRAMLAKRRQRQALQKKLAAAAAKKAAANKKAAPAGRPQVATPPRTPAQPAAPRVAARPAARPASGGGSIVQLQTSQGNIEVKLFTQKAPITTANFLQYVRSGHYNGTIFHRVIPNFMIQGGGMTPGMKKKPTRAPIKNEADNGLKNELGTLAMARTGAPHSASAQFFINTKNNTFLNHRSKANGRTWGYAVFGKVIKGMDVVMKISSTPTTSKNFRRNVPVTPILIKKAVVLQ